ncbi:MAG TPA: hypothetical protein VHL59_18985, partial [Thermoanaerobaculia bacterium]|nr:hypothetical protein [Thermoanaerobaculia bacterium]
MGRVTAMNTHAVESIAKKDLSKVVATIEASTILPEKSKEAITEFLKSFQEAQQAILALASIQLPDPVVAKIAELRQKVVPLVAHVRPLLDEGGTIRPEVIVKDVVALREFPAADVMKIVTELQSQIDQAAAADRSNAVLQSAAMHAGNLTHAAADLNARLGAAIARLRERIDTIETWYDTVMQGFEERYARHMRTWGFIISLVVAVAMNADLSQIYKRMATDDVSKQILVDQFKVLREQAARTAAEQQQNPARQQDASTKQTDTVQAAVADLQEQLDEVLVSYPALGLEPLDPVDWFTSTNIWQKIDSIVGWIIMAFLLSLGAPFWHDALESLFGLKNLLRNKTETRNVEQRSGEGAVRST